MNKNSPTRAFILAAILICLGIISNAMGIKDYIDTKKSIENCTEKTTATVLRIDERSEQSKMKHMMYRAELAIEGRSYILVSPWSDKKFRSNTTIVVYYDPESPDSIYIPSNPPFPLYSSRRDILWGIGCLLISLLSLWDGIRLKKKEVIL